jgi:hypothetical protein
MKKLHSLWLTPAVFALGCADVADTGTLVVSVSGEEAAVTGFPVEDDGEKIEFADGWTLEFSKALVSFGYLSVKGADGAVAVADDTVYVADLHAGDAEVATFEGLEARRWENFSFAVASPEGSVKKLGAVTDADVDALKAGGFNYWFEGTAKKGTQTVSFSWKVKNPTNNAECTNGDDGKQGVVVKPNSTAEAEVTIHVDHLFWDTLGSEEAALRFDAIAAKADVSGAIAWSALETQPLDQPLDAQGAPIKDADGKNISYNPGTVSLSGQHLAGFITASSSSSGHLNGGGLCTVTKR